MNRLWFPSQRIPQIFPLYIIAYNINLKVLISQPFSTTAPCPTMFSFYGPLASCQQASIYGIFACSPSESPGADRSYGRKVSKSDCLVVLSRHMVDTLSTTK